MTTLTLSPDTTAPDATCDVCGAWPLNQCHGLDGHPLVVPHAERTETTPLYDALAAATLDSLPSRTRADAGAPPTAIRPWNAGASARPETSTAALTPSAGQGTLVGSSR